MNKAEPFYLKSPKNNMRRDIATALIIILLSIANPLFLIILVGYLLYLFNKVKYYRSYEGQCLEKAINYFKAEDYIACKKHCLEILEKQSNYNCSIMLALCYYYTKDYELFIKTMEELEGRKKIQDIDVKLKLGKAYEELGEGKKAKELYEELLKLFPKSKFLQDKLKN